MCEVLRSCELCNYVFVSEQVLFGRRRKQKPEQYQEVCLGHQPNHLKNEQYQ